MNKFTHLALGCALTLTLSACSGGGNKFFQDLNLKVMERDNASYVQMTTVFELGNVSLAEATFTIMNNAGTSPMGTVSFSQLPTGQGTIALDVNASLLAGASADLGETLPNGRALPLSLNLQHGDSLGAPVGEFSRVYLGGSLNKTIFAGVAFGIKGLDEVMHRLNTAANVFFLFRPSDQLMGAGGIYGSPNKNENGVAVFAKYTRDGGLLDEEIDETMDNDFYEMDKATQKGVMNFFYGAPRTLEVY